MSQSLPNQYPVIFADSNVFIETLFVEESPAATVMWLVALGLFKLVTCATIITDVENAIINKVTESPSSLDDIMQRWAVILEQTNLEIHPDRPSDEVRAVYKTYIAVMRHKNDIPVLAAAINCKPQYILSSNYEHFNNRVAERCGISIFTCAEFLEFIGRLWIK